MKINVKPKTIKFKVNLVYSLRCILVHDLDIFFLLFLGKKLKVNLYSVDTI